MNNLIENIVSIPPANAEHLHADGAIPVYSRQRRQFVPTSILSFKFNKLSNDVSVATGTAYSNGPSVALEVGTWYITAHATINRVGTGTRNYTVRLHDGTTTLCSSETTGLPATHSEHVSLTFIVVLSSPATIVLQAVADASGATLKATTPLNSEAGATVISAIRIA